MFGQLVDHIRRQRAFAHIGERRGIDDVIAMTGAQQAEEVEAALRAGGAEPGEMVVADLGAEAVLRLMAGAGVIDRDPGGVGQPGAEHIARFGMEAIMAVIEQADHLALGERMPSVRNSVTSRGAVVWP